MKKRALLEERKESGGWEGVRWINLAHDMDKQGSLVSLALSRRVPRSARNRNTIDRKVSGGETYKKETMIIK
jgi:hypothetical protein